MFLNNKVSRAVSLAIAFGAASAASFSTTAYAQQDADAAEEAVAERIQVTGSRLRRTDFEGALPVTVIDRLELNASGDISVADYLRDTNFNSFGSYQSTSGSSGGGASQISLRGLGAERTLILIDGRRSPSSPITGGGQDLNTIPMAAVERIEVLTDGASAVYGSDAIAGVINIITRKDFDGVEIMYGAGRPSNAGGDTEEMSFVVGTTNDKGRVMFGASYNKRDEIYTRDRDYWYSPDSPGRSTYSNNFSQLLPNGDGGFTRPTSLGDSGRLRHPEFGAAVPGLCTNGDDSDLFYTTGDSADNITCQYNHSATSANLTSVSNLSMFGRGSYEISDNWSTYFNGTLSKVESFGRFAALPSSPWAGGAILLEAGSPNHPGTAPEDGGNNPFYDEFYAGLAGEDLALYHRFAALGPRDNSVENTTTDFNGGFEGTIGDYLIDVGARYVKSRAVNLGNNYVVSGLAQPYITSGEYNIYDPFAGNPTSLGMTTTTNRDMYSTVKEFYGNVSFDLFDLPAGMVAAAVGAEYREETYQDQYDLLSASGQVSGSSGASAGGERDVTAFYAEMAIPVLDTLEVELAGRYDDYSDFGSEFVPKVAVRWRPTDEVLVRASYGKGFRAPTLNDISQEPAFSATYTNDEATCIALTGESCVGNADVQVNTYTMGNVNLGPEKSDQYSAGVVWEATEWLNLSLDYYNIEITNRISATTLATAVGCLRGTVNVCPSGVSQFANGTEFPNPELGVGVSFEGDDINGAITGAQLGNVNLGTFETDGFDFTARTNFDLGWGQLRNSFSTTYVNSYEVNGGDDAVGDYGYPEMKAQLSNDLTVGDFSFNWNISLTDSQEYEYALTDGTSDFIHVPTWIIHNIQASYSLPWNGTVTLGVNNVGDKAPADITLAGTSYDYYQYNPWGRVPYIRYTQSF